MIPAMVVVACVLGVPQATPPFVRFLRSRVVVAGVFVVAIGLLQAVGVAYGLAVTVFFGSRTCTSGSVLRTRRVTTAA